MRARNGIIKKQKNGKNRKTAQNSTRRYFASSKLVAEVIELKRTRKTVPPFLRDDHVDVEVDVDGFEREYSESNDPETEQYRLRMGECPGSFLRVSPKASTLVPGEG